MNKKGGKEETPSLTTITIPHRSRFRRLDALVCNAGLANTPGRSAEGFEQHMAVNYLGHFYLTKLLLDMLKANEGGARIVNVRCGL